MKDIKGKEIKLGDRVRIYMKMNPSNPNKPLPTDETYPVVLAWWYGLAIQHGNEKWRLDVYDLEVVDE